LALILAAATRDSGASVIVSEVESESQGNGESPVPSTDKMDQFNRYSTQLAKQILHKVYAVDSDMAVKALEGLNDNLEEFLEHFFDQFFSDMKEYWLPIEEFYNEIPAQALYNLVLGFHRTALKQNEDNCGKIELKYNPFHPDLNDTRSKATRSRREAELLRLTGVSKVVQDYSAWMTTLDMEICDFLTKFIPAYCDFIHVLLECTICCMELMEPEHIKRDEDWHVFAGGCSSKPCCRAAWDKMEQKYTK